MSKVWDIFEVEKLFFVVMKKSVDEEGRIELSTPKVSDTFKVSDT